MGVYSTSQFLGAFLGGAMGGWIYGKGGPDAVFLACGCAILVWLVIAIRMPSPRYLSSLVFGLTVEGESSATRLGERLRAVPGVEEAVVIPADGVAYLKVDSKRLDRDALDALRFEPAPRDPKL
jgi:MFS family permease